MIPTNYVPNSLRSLREQAGLRQVDVAKALGLVSSDRISHWEKGVAVPSIVNLFKLSVLYKVLPHKLYEELFREVEISEFASREAMWEHGGPFKR